MHICGGKTVNWSRFFHVCQFAHQLPLHHITINHHSAQENFIQ